MAAIDDAHSSPRKLPSIRRALLWLGIACTVPTILVASAAAYEDYLLRKDRVYETAVNMARTLVAELERELRGIESGLRILATSEELQQGKLGAFHRRLQDALQLQNVDGYVLLDNHDMLVANSSAPYPSPPIRSVLPDAIRQQARSPQGVVTNLFNTALRGEQTIAVGIPVTLQGQVQYSLFAEIRPQRISQILRRQALPAGWVAAALDKEALIVGRTREEARYIGQHAVPTLADAVRRQQDGTLHSTTKEGVPVLTAFSHSRDRMWAVAIGAPIASLQADLWRSMIWVLAVSLAIIAMGIWAAYRLALRIRTSITALIEPAIALGRGDTLPVPPTRYRETALLGSALRHAGQMLSDTQRLAYHDPLTSLCNRVLFTELASHALAAAARTSRSVAILAIDLDRFKIVNDTYGHGTGDRVLKIAAERMSGALRSSDVLSRFGGDEFVVLLDAGGQEAAEQVARNLNAALAAPYPGVLVDLSGSIGIAVFPDDGDTLNRLLQAADKALYRAKAAGRNRYATATRSHRAAASDAGDTGE